MGSLEPRKNPGLLLDALRAIPARDRPKAVFAGPAAGFDLAAESSRRGLTEWVEPAGVVADERLVELYATATALVFPSRYEGFGLPVVEAFACDTPVIASTAASVPEVAGDAAVLVDPDDPEALAEAIRELRDSPGRRDALVAAGRARLARRFSPEAVQAALAEVYDELEGAA